jgi:hypothetical protein
VGASRSLAHLARRLASRQSERRVRRV